MEGRIRVSVVATGIDAELMRLPEPKVQPIRPGIKPLALKPEPARPEPRIEPARPAVAMGVTNAVHRQHEALADELGAQLPARAVSPAEAMILGGEDAPAMEDEVAAMPAHASPPPGTPAAALAARAATVQRIEPLRAPEPERRMFGLFGRKKKDEPRLEPMPQRPAPRAAVAQPLARPQAQADAPKPAAQTLADDLFPDHKRDDQFEIPAFLRRQSN